MQAAGPRRAPGAGLASRGVRADQGADFLTPTLKALFPDPSSFMDMDAAASAILDDAAWIAASTSSPTMTSTAPPARPSWCAGSGPWARAADLCPRPLTEGYGPSAKAFDTLKASGADLVITVDCGAAANEAVAMRQRDRPDVVVIDHHMMREEPPPCLAVVNPNRPG
jgi:single-stranded-DNA-specific exonuclease